MKTSDEIKKGLECCAQSKCGMSECSYYRLGSGSRCIPVMCDDALVLIQQLVAQNAEKDARIQQLEAERDAAVADLADHCGSKTLCKKYDDGTCPHEFDCTLYLSTCQDFEWRGVQKEETT